MRSSLATLSLVPVLVLSCCAQDWEIVAPACSTVGGTIDVEIRADSLTAQQGGAQFHFLYDDLVWDLDTAFALGGYRHEGDWEGVVNAGLPGEIFALLWNVPPPAEPTGDIPVMTVRLVNVGGAATFTPLDLDLDRWLTPATVDIVPPGTPQMGTTVLIGCSLMPPSCAFTTPAAGATLAGPSTLAVDIDDPNMDPVDVTWEFEPVAGMGFVPMTRVGGGGSIDLAVPTPAAGHGFDWDVFADFTTIVPGVTLRVTVDDGIFQSTCAVQVTADGANRVPTCTPVSPSPGSLVLPLSSIVYDTLDPNGDLLTLTHELSIAGGAFLPATRAGGGSHVASGVPPAPGSSFPWDADTDVGGLMVPTSVAFRVTVDDVRGGTTQCDWQLAVVPHGFLCPPPPGTCGDCNQDGVVSILDALVAAQVGASVVTLSPAAFAACNVRGAVFPDPGSAVDVLDALLLAQYAAGLSVTLVCC